jgi:tetratricopeptide (TPR) repeat protein
MQTVQPLLEAQDLSGLCDALKSHWSCEQIIELLSSVDPSAYDARKVAILAIGMVGPTCAAPEIATLLRDCDNVVNQLAEHALWAIWFRAGSQEANHLLADGVEFMSAGDFSKALEHFNQAIHVDPDFAEAYNQRAIVYYLTEQYEKSAADCRRTIRRMVCHFGAWSGLGHCLAHLKRIPESIEAYEKALCINPHLACIRETVQALKSGKCR